MALAWPSGDWAAPKFVEVADSAGRVVYPVQEG